jgi:hypothetical protein
VAAIALGIGLLCLPAAIYGSSLKQPALLVPFAILTAGGLAGGLVLGCYALASWRRRVVLYEGGLVAHGPFGVVTCPWGELSGMYVVKAGLPAATELRFERVGDKPFSLIWVIPGQEDLAGRIWEAAGPGIRARAEAALERGESVEFGSFLSVAPKGMRFRPNGPKGQEHRLRWNQIASCVLGRYVTNPGAGGLAAAASVQTQIHIRPHEGLPWVIASGNVANFPLLLELLEGRFGLEVERQ